MDKMDKQLYEFLQKAAKFHGHVCPGLAIGCVASKIILKKTKPAKDEELVAIVENNTCAVDAIQVLTGCTLGKGNLIYKDYGKMVFTFYNRTTKKALRLSLKPSVLKEIDSEDTLKFFEKYQKGNITSEELEEFKKHFHKLSELILMQGEEIFNVSEVKMEEPEKARIFKSTICDKCGELVMESKAHRIGDKNFCTPCFELIKIGNDS